MSKIPLLWYLFLVEEPNNQYLYAVQEPGTQVLSRLQLCLCLDFVLDFVQDSVIFYFSDVQEPFALVLISCRRTK